MKEKIAICKSPSGTTYGYIYKKDGCFGYYVRFLNTRKDWKFRKC